MKHLQSIEFVLQNQIYHFGLIIFFFFSVEIGELSYYQ